MITLNIHKSPFGIDWSSPAKLTYSTFKNTIYSWFNKYQHPLGHVSVHIDCSNNKNDKYVGVERLNVTESLRLVLFDGAGLGTLLHNFQGRYQSSQEIIKDLNYNAEKSEVVLVSFKISDKACTNISKYLKTFEENEFWRNYGLPNRPLKGQGAGCTAFATSILQVAGIDFTQFDRHWSDHIFIPKTLVGPHNSEIYIKGEDTKKIVRNTISKIPFWSLFESNLKWEQNKDSTVIKYYSPDKMYEWTINNAENPESSDNIGDHPFIVKKHKKTIQLIYDFTNKYQHYEIERIQHEQKNI
jgi:hypothetical protein